jgi:hypothetical protein
MRAVVVLGLVGGTIAMAMGAAPASAGLGLACPSPTSTPFAGWKDYSHYAFAPDGGFESGGSGWVLSGGALLSSKMRFVMRGDSGSSVKVQIVYRGVVSSLLGLLDGGTASADGAWKPSPQVGMLGGVLPLLTASVSFRFTAVGGDAAIDDVYLDPMKSS